jgi:hypothetical protein
MITSLINVSDTWSPYLQVLRRLPGRRGRARRIQSHLDKWRQEVWRAWPHRLEWPAFHHPNGVEWSRQLAAGILALSYGDSLGLVDHRPTDLIELKWCRKTKYCDMGRAWLLRSESQVTCTVDANNMPSMSSLSIRGAVLKTCCKHHLLSPAPRVQGSQGSDCAADRFRVEYLHWGSHIFWTGSAVIEFIKHTHPLGCRKFKRLSLWDRDGCWQATSSLLWFYRRSRQRRVSKSIISCFSLNQVKNAGEQLLRVLIAETAWHMQRIWTRSAMASTKLMILPCRGFRLARVHVFSQRVPDVYLVCILLSASICKASRVIWRTTIVRDVPNTRERQGRVCSDSTHTWPVHHSPHWFFPSSSERLT